MQCKTSRHELELGPPETPRAELFLNDFWNPSPLIVIISLPYGHPSASVPSWFYPLSVLSPYAVFAHSPFAFLSLSPSLPKQAGIPGELLGSL